MEFVELDKLNIPKYDMNDNELKTFLFKENIRINNEKQELELLRNKFLSEKQQFQEDMRTLNINIASQRQRLKDDQQFFDKKLKILQSGFNQLDIDRQNFNKEKNAYKANMRSHSNSNSNSIFFTGITNLLALKKRHKELLKIFHPDNMWGDHDTIILINQEYERARDRIDERNNKKYSY